MGHSLYVLQYVSICYHAGLSYGTTRLFTRRIITSQFGTCRFHTLEVGVQLRLPVLDDQGKAFAKAEVMFTGRYNHSKCNTLKVATIVF